MIHIAALTWAALFGPHGPTTAPFHIHHSGKICFLGQSGLPSGCRMSFWYTR